MADHESPTQATPPSSARVADRSADRERTGELGRRKTSVSWYDGSLTISPKGITLIGVIVGIVWTVYPVAAALADGPRQLREVAAVVHDLTPIVQQLRSDVVTVKRDVDVVNASTAQLQGRVSVLETHDAGYAVLKDQIDRQLAQHDARLTALEQNRGRSR